MAAPEYVPIDPQQLVRSYSSPPWRPEPWYADRVAEIDFRQPEGDLFGVQGPDQGYALLLADRYRGRLHLTEGESEEDALAGVGAVATKRSGLFGRGPILHDLTAGLTVWGFLDVAAPPELVEARRTWFEEVHVPVHYNLLRRVADAVPDDVLLLSHEAIAKRYASDWRSCLDLTV